MNRQKMDICLSPVKWSQLSEPTSYLIIFLLEVFTMFNVYLYLNVQIPRCGTIKNRKRTINKNLFSLLTESLIIVFITDNSTI